MSDRKAWRAWWIAWFIWCGFWAIAFFCLTHSGAYGTNEQAGSPTEMEVEMNR